MYLFLDKYCKLTANLPESGIATLTGWIPFADAESLLLIDEDDNEILLKREQLLGSIVVLEKQRQLRVESSKEECSVGVEN